MAEQEHKPCINCECILQVNEQGLCNECAYKAEVKQENKRFLLIAVIGLFLFAVVKSLEIYFSLG